jgi:hypothetical protein
MSNKWLLQGVQREGFDGVWTPGRFWPSASPTEVEIVDGDVEPTIEVDARGGGKRKALDPNRMTAKAFERIMKDPRVSKVPVDSPGGGDVAALKSHAANLEALFASREAQMKRAWDEREQSTMQMREEYEASLAARDAEIARLNTELALARKATPHGNEEVTAAGQPDAPKTEAPPASPPAPVPEHAPAEKPMSKRHK